MIKLIDTRLVAKLMRETAKECGMTRVYSSTDSVWTAAMERLAVANEPGYQKAELVEKWAIERRLENEHRRIVKAYDFVADNFIELLEAKVKAEGFDLADNRITLSSCPSDEVDYDAMKEKYGKKYWRHEYKRMYKDHKMKGGTYVRMIASFIGERQYKTRYTVAPID